MSRFAYKVRTRFRSCWADVVLEIMRTIRRIGGNLKKGNAVMHRKSDDSERALFGKVARARDGGDSDTHECDF